MHKTKHLLLLSLPFSSTIYPGLDGQLRASLPPGALLAVPQHAHRCGHQHGEADAAVPRAHVQPAALHALGAERALEDGQRRGRSPRHGHPQRRELHARPVRHTHTHTVGWTFSFISSVTFISLFSVLLTLCFLLQESTSV